MNFTKHIPNTLTLANLLCGCLSIVISITALFFGNLHLAGLLIFLAALFDFLDGFAARLFNAYSDIGKQLDSLADMVSFGVAPAMMALQILVSQSDEAPFEGWTYIVFIMVLFSALRLAKFNIDTRQTDHFIGMPTPANAIFWGSLPLVMNDLYTRFPAETVDMLFHPIVIGVLCVVFAVLLVLPVPMLSFKFKTVAFKPNWQRFVLIWLILGLYFVIGVSAIPVGILVYPLLSLTLRK